LSDLSPLQLTLTAATNLRRNCRSLGFHQRPLSSCFNQSARLIITALKNLLCVENG
jgi:hypothetical protein